MKAESSFLDSAVSPMGAEGLMQIMPATQIHVAQALDLENIAEPQNNIRAGVYYLSRLYRLFDGADENDRLRLTLAAYNAGPGRVFDAQDIARYLNEDPTRWASIRDALPLLSGRYYTLHRQVWEKQRPRSGIFTNPRETISYVEKVMNYYDEYRLALN
jgi:membrane-bound lytic murein transglycosylase F